MILKLGLKHQAIEHYKVCINHDPGMTLSYFITRSTKVPYPRSQNLNLILLHFAANLYLYGL